MPTTTYVSSTRLDSEHSGAPTPIFSSRPTKCNFQHPDPRVLGSERLGARPRSSTTQTATLLALQPECVRLGMLGARRLSLLLIQNHGLAFARRHARRRPGFPVGT